MRAYPMCVVEDLTPRSALDQIGDVADRRGLGDEGQALILKVASTLFSTATWWSDYRITPEYLSHVSRPGGERGADGVPARGNAGQEAH
jgi:hypothetical protein